MFDRQKFADALYAQLPTPDDIVPQVVLGTDLAKTPALDSYSLHPSFRTGYTPEKMRDWIMDGLGQAMESAVLETRAEAEGSSIILNGTSYDLAVALGKTPSGPGPDGEPMFTENPVELVAEAIARISTSAQRDDIVDGGLYAAGSIKVSREFAQYLRGVVAILRRGLSIKDSNDLANTLERDSNKLVTDAIALEQQFAIMAAQAGVQDLVDGNGIILDPEQRSALAAKTAPAQPEPGSLEYAQERLDATDEDPDGDEAGL